MRDRVIGLLEKADLALGSAAGVVAEAALAPIIESVRAVRARLAFPEDVLVVALAGGTGSGKSSLFNAMCGEELVDVGGMRPTTSQPAAAVPERLARAMDGYLDELRITERHTHSGPPICLMDLPDTDSIEIEHRHRVDSLLSRLDLVVWVTDPEKYRDARLHDEYLRPMAGHGEQFVHVMNQIDRLTPAEAEAVCHDLAEALAEDGLGEVEVIPVAAAPPSGPPIGIDRLMSSLGTRARSSTLYAKLLDDVTQTCQTLHQEAGGSLDFDARAAAAVGSATEALVDDDRQLAVATLTGFLDEVEVEVGGPIGDQIAAIAAEVPGHIRRIVDAAVSTPPAPRRRFLRRVEPEPADPKPIEALIAEAVIRPVRALLAKRALAVAAVAELVVGIEEIRTGR